MPESLHIQLRNYFRTQPIEKAWLFGSFARGDQREDSDADIMVRFDKSARISLLGLIHIKNELQDLLGRDVDLMQEGCLRPFAVESAEHDKILIYKKNN